MILFIDWMEYKSNTKCTHKLTPIGKLNSTLFRNVVRSLYDNLPDYSVVAVLYAGRYSGNKPKLVKRLYKLQRELSNKVFALFYYPAGVKLMEKSGLNTFYGIVDEKYESEIPHFSDSGIIEYL